MEWKIILNKSALPSEKCSHRTASKSALTLYQSTALCAGGPQGTGDSQRQKHWRVPSTGDVPEPGMCQQS